jgi:hypothetical protein
VQLSYHWLDDRGNAIVWDGPRVAFERAIAPGDEVEVELVVRAPQPPGRYRLAFDLVEELRFWFAEVGSRRSSSTPRCAADRRAAACRRRPRRRDAETTAALAAQEEPLVEEDAVAPRTSSPGASRRRLVAADPRRARGGLRAVGGSIETRERALRPGRPAAAATRASPSRSAARRSCRLEPVEHEGLPAYDPDGEPRSSTGGSDFDCHAVVDAR